VEKQMVAAWLGSMATTLLMTFLGWLLINFYLSQILSFRAIRRDIHETMYYVANARREDLTSPQLLEAIDWLRRLAAQLDALRISLEPPSKWWLRRKGYDLDAAVKGLTGYSNSFHTTDGSRGFHRRQAERALKLPT